MSTSLPSAIQKRDQLWNAVKKGALGDLAKQGKAFEAEGWLYDAVEFYAQGRELAELRRLRQAARDEGDTFLFLRVCHYLGETDFGAHPEAAAELRRCGERALELKKMRFAIRAFDKVGDTERAEELRTSIASDGDIRSELESRVFIPEAVEEAAAITEE